MTIKNGEITTSNIEIFSKSDLFNGTVDPAFSINGVDHIDDDAQVAWDVLVEAKLVDGDKFVVPAGSTLVDQQPFGGATECTFGTPSGLTLQLDLELDLD